MKKQQKSRPESRAALVKNQTVQVTIEALSSEGSGVGHSGGMTLFVPHTAVGDVCEALIIKVQKNYAVSKLVRLLGPSADRVESDCPVSSRCGGCVYRHISYEAECKAKYQKVADAIQRIAKLPVTPQPLLPSGQTAGYRNKAQYPVRREEGGRLQIGFFAPRSHRVVDCRECLLQPPLFTKALAAFAEYMENYQVSAYDEVSGKGLVRHFMLRMAPATGQMMALVVVNGSGLPHEDELVALLCQAVPELKSVVINENRLPNNLILGANNRVLWGGPTIEDVLCGLKITLSPHSFYQVNSPQAEKLYRLAAKYAALDPGSTVLDLYCGAGAIGLSMAHLAGQVIGVEVVPQAVEDAKRNAVANGIDNARFLCADAAKAAQQLAAEGIKPDVVLLDPPRKGCDEALLHTVAEDMAPSRVVYISCDPATLARDAAVLAGLGYQLEEVTPVDLFPRTAHVETVCLLSKLKSNKLKHIDVELEMDEFDLTSLECKCTYNNIKQYVFDKYGFKVSNLYIAQVKEKCGIKERENYNKPKNVDSKQPICPTEKEEAIRDAFRHFQMI